MTICIAEVMIRQRVELHYFGISGLMPLRRRDNARCCGGLGKGALFCLCLKLAEHVSNSIAVPGRVGVLYHPLGNFIRLRGGCCDRGGAYITFRWWTV